MNRSTANDDHDDQSLRKVFDSRDFWYSFSYRANHASAEESSGLLRNKHLRRPEGFLTYVTATTRRCQRLVKKIEGINSVEGYKNIVKDFDRLSDLLCRVLDVADFIKNNHPDQKFQRMASQAFATMYEYMNQMNTAPGLNTQLGKAKHLPEVYNSWSEEEKIAAEIFRKDFSKSAIDLTLDTRKQFVNLSNKIMEAGYKFTDYMAPKTQMVRFRSGRLAGVDPMFIRRNTTLGLFSTPSMGYGASHILQSAHNPEVRKEMYFANRTASDATVSHLGDLLMYRSQLASLAGFESYAHMTLSDKMAKSPEAVHTFLSSLHADANPMIHEDMAELLEMKRNDETITNFDGVINAWDKDYYAHQLKVLQNTLKKSKDSLESYFSLGTVFQGLSRLFSNVYGIRLVPRETKPGETWHGEVRRLDVVDENNNIVAIMYCDLFTRSGKTHNPAHFTLRCSRALLPDEIEEYIDAESLHPFSDPISAATEGNAYSHDPATDTIHQLPTIALVCDFQHGNPTLLSFRDLQTMFHEMGHALHSILGQTNLQNVAGTRCPTDLAEVPSVLMEHFALAPQVLSLWARHWKTDKLLPPELVKQELSGGSFRQKGLDTEDQIMMARLDQGLHSRLWCNEGDRVDSTAVYHHISKMTSVPDPPGISRQGFFGHLYGYGATYYSYLFARAVAGKVWRDVFGAGRKAVDRDAGDRLKTEFLRYGGSRDGWLCVAGMLQDERLAEGGESAMKIVGGWGSKKGDNTDVHLH